MGAFSTSSADIYRAELQFSDGTILSCESHDECIVDSKFRTFGTDASKHRTLTRRPLMLLKFHNGERVRAVPLDNIDSV